MEFFDEMGSRGDFGDDREIGQVLINGPAAYNAANNSRNYGEGDDATFIVEDGTVVFNVTEADFFVV